MSELIADYLRTSYRRPQVAVVALLIVVIPPVLGIISAPAYSFDHWMSYFTVMFDGVGLIFPLLVALLTQPKLLDEWSNTYALATRLRVAPAAYFGVRVIVSGILASVVFFALTAVCFAAARLTYIHPGPEVPLVAPVETRYQLSQLWALSPVLYMVVFCLWVALVAGTVAVACTLFTAVISNKFVALAAPLILWFLANFGLAVLRLEAFALPPFRFHIRQQPVWTEIAGWAAILLVVGALYAFVHRRDYQTAGIVRT